MVIEFHNQALDTPTHVALCGAKIWCIVVKGVHTYSDVGLGVENKQQSWRLLGEETAKHAKMWRDVLLYGCIFKRVHRLISQILSDRIHHCGHETGN